MSNRPFHCWLAALLVAAITSLIGEVQAQVDYLEGIGVGDPAAFGTQPNGRSWFSHNTFYGRYASNCSLRLLSGDGSRAVFVSDASNLVADDTNGVADVFVRDATGGSTLMVSVSSNGVPANGPSTQPSLSPNGRFVVFESEATNLVAEATQEPGGVYLRDIELGITRRVVSGWAYDPVVSNDGRWVAYNKAGDIHLRDMQSNTLLMVSRPNGIPGDPDQMTSRCPSISGDGQHVAFESVRQDLVPIDTPDDVNQVYVFYRDTRSHFLISVDEHGVAGDGYSIKAAISEDGGSVAFITGATTFGATNEPAGSRIAVRDLEGNLTVLPVAGFLQGASLDKPAISANGQRVSAAAHPASTDDDSQRLRGVVWDRVLETIERVEPPADFPPSTSIFSSFIPLAINSDGTQLLAWTNWDSSSGILGLRLSDRTSIEFFAADSGGPFPGSANAGVTDASVSNDGRFVAFVSSASNLSSEDADGWLGDVFLLDRATGETRLVAVQNEAAPDARANGPVDISDDGRYLAFHVNGDTTYGDAGTLPTGVYRYDRISEELARADNTPPPYSNPPDFFYPYTYPAGMSATGRFVAFNSDSPQIVSGDNNQSFDGFVRDMDSDLIERVTLGQYNLEPNGDSWVSQVSGDGRFVLFRSFATNVRGDGVLQVASSRHFIRDRTLQSSIPVDSLVPDHVGVNIDEVSMSDDARFVVIYLWLPLERKGEVYLADRRDGSYRKLDIPGDDRPNGVLSPTISGDGRYIGFFRGVEEPSPSGQGASYYRLDVRTGALQRMSEDRQGNDASPCGVYQTSLSANAEWAVFRHDPCNLGLIPPPLLPPYPDAPPPHLVLDAGTHGSGFYLSHAIGTDLSGAFYDPANSGHGWLFEQLETDSGPLLVATWYAYRDGKQLWMLGTAPIQNGGTSIPMTLFSGGDFPPAFDPASVATQPFGTLDIVMSDVDAGHATWTSEVDGLGSGEADFVRLSTISNTNHPDELSGCHSGSWYDPQQSGHGLQLQVIDSGDTKTAIAIWYHYLNGEPRWLLGSGPVDGDHADLAMAITHGADFPPDYDPADKVQEPWGVLRFTVNSANQAQINWDADYAGYGDGSMNLQRLTQLDGHACILN
ncbi:MAG: hypothetical protein R3F22_09060 [Lysobacteraceae bacterium]